MFARLQILGLALVGATIIGCQAPLDVPHIYRGDGYQGTDNHVDNDSLTIAGPRLIRVKGRYTWQVSASGSPLGCTNEWVASYPGSGRNVVLGSGDSQSLVVRLDDGDIQLTVLAPCLAPSLWAKLLVVNRIAP